MILGYPIRVWPYHTAIQNLFKHKNLRGRLARWFVILQSYEVTFEYIPGKKNIADTLSRNISSHEDTEMPVCNVSELITLEDVTICEEQRKDELWKAVIEYLENPVEGRKPKLPGKLTTEEFEIRNNLLFRKARLNQRDLSREEVRQLVIPHSMVPDVIKILHDSAPSSHPGKDKTHKQAQIKYFWPHMRKNIYTHVDNCQTCAEIKGNTKSPAPMLTYPIPEKPWERVHIENGFKYLFVAIDYFSRFCILQPMENKRAATIASVIYSRIIADFTTPRSVITDNGSEFNNKVFEELSKLFQVKKINVQTYNPQSNDVVERLNKKIINCLRALINPYSIEWDKWIPTVKCALNAQVNAATGESPHYIIFGEDKLLPYELLNAEPRPI